MSIDYTKIQQVSSATSNKVLLQGTGSFNIAALGGAGETTSSATIPHAYDSDNLLIQVTAYSTTPGALIDQTRLPWASNDGRIILYTSIDSTNVYVTAISNDSSGLGAPARTVDYVYRILVP